MNQKHQQRTYHVNVNVALVEQNVIQINGEMTINVDVSIKNIMYVKKIMFRILLNVIVRMENIHQVLVDDSAFVCDEIIKS